MVLQPHLSIYSIFIIIVSKFSTIMGSRKDTEALWHLTFAIWLMRRLCDHCVKITSFLHDSTNMFVKCHIREREKVFAARIDSRQDIFQTSHLDATSNVSWYIATVPFRHIGRSQIVIGVKITWFILNDVRAATRDKRHTAGD